MNRPGLQGAIDAQRAAGPRLFILDVRNRVERGLALDRLGADWGEVAAEERVALPLSNEEERRDLRALQDRLERADGACMVVPVRIAWRIPGFDSRRPLRLRDLLLGDPRLPGALRARLILLRSPRRAQVLVGKPATLAELQERYRRSIGGSDEDPAAGFAAWVARQASVTLEAEERRVRGTRYKVPRYVADSIAASRRFRGEIGDLVTATGRPRNDVLSEARGYMKELISTPSALFLDLRARFERFLMTQGYDKGFRFDPAELEALREMMRTRPTVLLFTHKTYLDGVTPNALAYDNDLPMLHSFGGINLDMFALGTLFRRSGMIFIRRSFQDLPVYKAVLRHYIAYLLEKRFPMSWALEGTRSRLGKLMPPKYGILKYVIDAAHHGRIEDLHVVPFVTSFDLIRDVEEYAAEQTGRTKKPESLVWFLGYLKSLREPMGRVRIDLGAPVVVRQAPDPEDRAALARIAFDASVSANRVTPLTVTAVMCLVLLGTAPRGATERELLRVSAFLVDWARARGIRLSDELAGFDRAAMRATADRLVASGLILRDDHGSETVYTIEPAKHPMASYYRNSVIHHFLDKTLIELALFRLEEDGARRSPAAFWAEIERLRNLFKFEFFYPPRAEFHRAIEAELTRTDPEWSQHLQGGRSGIQRLIRRFQPLVGHAALLPFVEAYQVVFELLVALREGEQLSREDCVARGLVEGRQAYMLRRISSEASIGKILFENGYLLAVNLDLAGVTDAAAIARRKELLAELQALARRMERMRIDVLAAAERDTLRQEPGKSLQVGNNPSPIATKAKRVVSKAKPAAAQRGPNTAGDASGKTRHENDAETDRKRPNRL